MPRPDLNQSPAPDRARARQRSGCATVAALLAALGILTLILKFIPHK